MEENFHVYLRGIDISKLTKKYLSGDYKNLNEVSKFHIESENEEPSLITSVPIHQEKNIPSSSQIAMINYKIYNNQQYSRLDPSKRYNCMYCLRPIEESPIGIPLRREKIEEITYYHMIDVFCSVDCALAELLIRANNPHYASSSEYLTEVSLALTGKYPRPASDKRLLEIFNGQMSWEEFHHDTERYSSKPSNMCFLPAAEMIENDKY